MTEFNDRRTDEKAEAKAMRRHLIDQHGMGKSMVNSSHLTRLQGIHENTQTAFGDVIHHWTQDEIPDWTGAVAHTHEKPVKGK